MSDILKCPYCGEILEQSSIFNLNSYACTDLNCKGYFMTAPKDMWQELIRTRKALDVAVDALNKINMRCQNTIRNHLERATIRGELCDISFYARKAIDDIDNLEQITALEQKDVK